MAKAKVLILTKISAETLNGMGARVFSDLDPLLAEVDFAGKDVYVMPYGGYTVPFLTEKSESDQ